MKGNKMIRYEVKTPHKAFVGCEDTLEEATAYIAGLIEAGVEILKVEYFDKEQRITDIRNGNFNTPTIREGK
jgi:hypothetical protein